jgi:hypothetical protein
VAVGDIIQRVGFYAYVCQFAESQNAQREVEAARKAGQGLVRAAAG